jgi:hypothetical protein
MTKIAGSGSFSRRHGSADPDPYQNVMDPQHCIHVIASHCVQEYFLEDCIQMTNFVPGPALALRGRDKKNNKKGNNEEEDDEGMDDDEGECTLTRSAKPQQRPKNHRLSPLLTNFGKKLSPLYCRRFKSIF